LEGDERGNGGQARERQQDEEESHLRSPAMATVMTVSWIWL
jgi:hypothetical protein